MTHQNFMISTAVAAERLGVTPDRIRQLKRKLHLIEGIHWTIRVDTDVARIYWSDTGLGILANHLGVNLPTREQQIEIEALTGVIEALGMLILPCTAAFFACISLPFWLHGRGATHD